MDESTIGSLRHRVPILDGEYFHEWKNEMLVIFNEYHLNKYITSLVHLMLILCILPLMSQLA